MYEEISKLILFRDDDKESILYRLGDIFYRFDNEAAYHDNAASKQTMIDDIYSEIKNILKVATDFGFNENLWHNYLTFYLITNENPFSLTCEKVGASDGASVNIFAKNDCEVFMKLFHYDFSQIEDTLGIKSFSVLEQYHAVAKKDLMYNKNVSEKVQALSKKLAAATDVDEFFDALTGFYLDYGVGMFGLNKAFRIKEKDGDGDIIFCPINNMDTVVLDDLVGYEIQKKKLVDNTESFVEGKPANNCLLFGDSGTGKSTSIKAIVNQYYDRGLRMIEIYKHQFKDLSNVIAQIKNRNYKFIIYMDDLSFEEFEIEYKFLKAVIEGGVETKPDNILIYATSNRRHLIKENWNDRNDMQNQQDIHHSDTIEEKLSLVNRFGVTINYSKPSQKEYFNIVVELAKKSGLDVDEETLKTEANKWELSHGGISGRTAQQFINYMRGIR
ncbi:MAG: ATP-binding protein [Lachnospiraceae bacterium]